MSSFAQLVAHTKIDTEALEDLGYEVHTDMNSDEFGVPRGEWYRTASDADELAEFSGRNCYQSFHRPNPATATNRSYLGHILDVGHESVLEHSTASFFVNASRSVLTELERHRHLSFSVVSQRYVDVTELGFHMPPAVLDIEDDYLLQRAYETLVDGWYESKEKYEALVEIFTEAGKGRKQAREAARAVVPNMADSPMIVTGNLRAWRYVIKARFHEAADAEIREVARQILVQLRDIAPSTFQDIPNYPYSY